jgi:hypothetical protein
MSESKSGGGEHLKLLTRLKNWKGGAEEPNHLILVSFSTLGMTEEEDQQLRKKTDESFERSRERRGAEVYRLTNTDTALLMKLNEYNQMEWTSELKVDLIRVIQQNFPEYFGQIDQSRMLRIINLQGRIGNAIKFLETFDDRAKEAGVGTGESRPLRESDIQIVRDGMRKMGKKTFTDNFVRSQATVLITPGKPPMPVMREYFISIEMIRQHILTHVDFRGAGLVFQHLTRSLDQMLIDCFDEVNPDRAKASLNLNVETVFTHSFQNLLEKGDKALGNLVLEFRAENILQNWDQFQTASELITSRGGTIAIDAIIPESLGVMDLSRLGAKLAKVFWRPGTETTLPAMKETIQKMQQRGTVLVLARVDDEQAIKVGHSVGITMFQGFHIDDMVQ